MECNKMHNIKKTIILFTSLILYFSLCLSVKAESIIPYASDVFISYSASLSSSKIATFSCDLKNEYASVKVSKCVIQKCTKVAVKEEDCKWKDVKTLSNVCSATNSDYLSGSKDLSSYIGSGTYRISVTYTTGGESRTITSNKRTFN